MIKAFLAGVHIQEQYLKKSQQELDTILDQCLMKSENINDSSLVTQEKCQIIHGKLAKIPKLQNRIEAVSKVFLEAHKRIENLNKILAHITKQGIIKPFIMEAAVEEQMSTKA